MDSTLNVTGLDGKGIQRILDTTARIETPPWYWIALTLVLSGYLLSLASVHVLGPKAPLVGIQSIFEPRIVGNWRFFRNSSKIIDEGYNKSKSKAFKFVRNDADMVILPASAVEEIRALPREVANPTIAHAHNLLGNFTKMDLILRSDLHFRMIQTKVTPNLGALTGPMEEEIRWAMQRFPDCKDKWTMIKPYHTMLDLVASTSARVFVGLPLCRDPAWLEASVQFTENIFVTVCTMRLFPTFMHPLLAWLLPSNWRSAAYIARAQKIFVPEILRRRALLSQNKLDPSTAQTLLSWMIECASPGPEQNPLHLAHLEIVISLAAIHTSQMNAVHVLYDLAARPSYIDDLRDEIQSVASSTPAGWTKSSYAQLRKLDSFMKESQRFNPPSVLSYHRVMTAPHTLADGTHLPRNSHISLPVHAMLLDPQNVSGPAPPDEFDGLRYSRLRQNPREAHLHQFATTAKNSLNFGHGAAACPGRFFASLEIKCILVRFIMNYDFRLVEGDGGRPQNLRAHEFIFPNPEGRLEIKEREKGESPF
ncbi:hypothetical protein MMC10_007230 [Thelotrema lepadinum]|nr:hypothetical protein [Thelotrema lepadinum]